jgi:hypothetical protein
MPRDVRSHTRRTSSGRTTTVRQHTRRGPDPRHALKLGRRAVSHGKRGRKGVAAALVTFAIAEVILWAAFNITGVACGLAGALLIGIAAVLVSRKQGA